MNLLFNLVAVQPIHSAKFHGGGSYGEVIFWALVKRLYGKVAEPAEVADTSLSLFCAYDSRKYLDPAILETCKEKNIPLFDISEKTPQQIIDENQIDTFYTPLYSLEKKMGDRREGLRVYLARRACAGNAVQLGGCRFCQEPRTKI